MAVTCKLGVGNDTWPMLNCKRSWGGVWGTAGWQRAEVQEAVLVMTLSGPVPRNVPWHQVTCRDITPAGLIAHPLVPGGNEAQRDEVT